MKKHICTALFIVAVAAATSSAQMTDTTNTTEYREAMFRRQISEAKWVSVTVSSEDDSVMFVDSKSMSRSSGLAVFITMKTRRGSTTYMKILGGCTTDRMKVTQKYVMHPGAKYLVGGELEGSEFIEVEKGEIGYLLLDYVCTKAPIFYIK